MAEDSSDQLQLRLGPPGELAPDDATTTSSLHHHAGGAKRTFHQTKPDDDHHKPWFTLDNQALNSSSTNTHPPKSRSSTVGSAPVVGWPPIRSCRIKNLAISSLKKEDAKDKSTVHVDHHKSTSANELVGDHDDDDDDHHHHKKRPFIKINMEGIPIGRKINLSAYNSYHELSLAIHQLFATLLAAQGDSADTKIARSNMINVETKGSSLARGGEYTLVYEDDEGDRILVGDIPWNMFVTTAKRLRVLRSPEKTTQSTHPETRAPAAKQ